MNNSSFSDLFFIGLVIYVFYQLLKSLSKGNQPRQHPTPRADQQNPDLMDFFRSAVDQIKNEAAYQNEGETDEPAALPPKEIEMSKQMEEIYTEQMAEPTPLIAKQVKREAPRKTQFRDKSKIEPSFEYLKPGELVISGDDKTDIPPIHEKLFDSLGDPHNLQHAILLREVLDPPLSKRKQQFPKR